MTSRSKEKMAAAFRRLFMGRKKHHEPDQQQPGLTTESPARRLLKHGAVQPVDGQQAGTVAFRKVRSRSEANTHHEKVRARRLMKELKDAQRLSSSTSLNNGDPPFTVELINDNLFEWHVHLHRIDAESDLAADMRELGITSILLHVTFPDNFPFSPPFMRVVTPTIEKGYVMEGGAICMELLTPRGWASAYTVEAVITQFAASLVKGQGRISRKTNKSNKEFNKRAAEESFRNLVKTHDKYGWVTPPLTDG